MLFIVTGIDIYVTAIGARPLSNMNKLSPLALDDRHFSTVDGYEELPIKAITSAAVINSFPDAP